MNKRVPGAASSIPRPYLSGFFRLSLFEPAIAPSGEEAVILLRGSRRSYRALVPAPPNGPPRGVPNSILLEKPLAPAQLVTAVSQLLIGRTPKA